MALSQSGERLHRLCRASRFDGQEQGGVDIILIELVPHGQGQLAGQSHPGLPFGFGLFGQRLHTKHPRRNGQENRHDSYTGQQQRSPTQHGRGLGLLLNVSLSFTGVQGFSLTARFGFCSQLFGGLQPGIGAVIQPDHIFMYDQPLFSQRFVERGQITTQDRPCPPRFQVGPDWKLCC